MPPNRSIAASEARKGLIARNATQMRRRRIRPADGLGMRHREMQQCTVWRIFRGTGTASAPKNALSVFLNRPQRVQTVALPLPLSCVAPCRLLPVDGTEGRIHLIE